LIASHSANLPTIVVETLVEQIKQGSGIYYGWASIGRECEVYPMVMSIGWNPFYKNEKRNAVS
jgi:riboflavin kinase